MDGDKVTGIRGHSRNGQSVTETAKVVIGADGLHSRVAEAVKAPRYNEKPALACYYYSYWSGLPGQLELALGDGCMFVTFPTNDGLICAGAGLENDQVHTYRADLGGTDMRTLQAPS